jgi:protein involved in polysaccharide export with SLBB domain
VNGKQFMKDQAIVPDNETGAGSDIEHSVQKENERSARQLFQLAKQRLMDVNHWHQLSGPASATFTLTDAAGNEVDRPVQSGDHLKIDIPGPGSLTGEGYDWVQVEAVEAEEKSGQDFLSIRVRPTPNPQNNNEDVAHFFTGDASSTFSVLRKGNMVIAGVYGRNEKPNLNAKTMVDKLRNAVVGVTAIAGLNKPQWKSLVLGLLHE